MKDCFCNEIFKRSNKIWQERKKEMITISKEEYEQLLDKERKLECLECCGVDNWGGWDDAMEMYRQGDEE